jgi:L-ascorbate metabolism protein UlaG (beta-lactamase superfamily)
MSQGQSFIRPNLIVEPLVDRFYAWLYTVAPIQGAMNLTFLQVPLLESYLQSPQAHVLASTNPELRGGYFVGIEEARKDEVKALLDSIRKDRADMLKLAQAVADAEDAVRQGATGFDLTPLYPKLPPELAGLVEVAYDTSNQASVHFLEPLAYQPGVHDVSRQSVQLSLEDGIERPFILSTPRLPKEGTLDLRIPFNHPGLQELFLARIRPSSLDRLSEALELGAAGRAQLAGFLTDSPSLSPDRHIEAGARVRYFGHACLVLQTPEVAIVTDPFISAESGAAGRYTLDDLPDHIDYVLITHGHQDHIVLETLMQLRGRVGTVVVPRCSRGNLVDPSLRLYLESIGLPVIEADDFDELKFPGGRIVATPFLGEHADLDIRAKSTYFVDLGGRSLWLGADSSGIEPALYRRIRAHVGKIDMAYLGMECDGAPLTWLYQALLTQPITKRMSDSRKLSGSNAAQAGDIVDELGASEAYIYAMGEEHWLGHVMATSYNDDSYQLKQVEEFLARCADKGVKAGHLFGQQEWRW